MVETGGRRIGERRIKCRKDTGRRHFGRCHQQRAEAATVGLIAFVVDVDALAVVGGFTHRMFVVQQQIVQAVQRPGSRETQGEKQAPKAPQVECAGQSGVILKGEVNGRNERSKGGRRLIAQYLQKRRCADRSN